MKVLYVEDNPRDADLTRRWMHKRAPQLTLEIATTQSEAVARLSSREAASPYDLVLTDLRLPDGDGLALLSYIRERGLPLAVVVITGTGDEATAVGALKAGADDYMAKRNDYLERLPLTLESALRRHRAQAARQTRPLKVLYAEHHHADVDLTRRHLLQHAPHIQLDVVPTADEALALLPQTGEDTRYDVILLDYRLPGMNALEALKELREERGLDIPVLLITGQGDEEVALQALKLGAASYIVKNPGYLYQLPHELENAHYRAEILREQTALRASEERFAKAFHSNPQPMSITTLAEGRYVDANESFIKMSGYTREEIIGHTSLARNVWGSPEVRADFVSQLRQQGAIRNLETRFRTKGGGFQVLLSSAELIELGGTQCILMCSSNITERKQVEEALRESEERFRNMADHAPVMVWMTEADGTCTYVSQSWCKFTGQTPETSLGFGWVAALHPDDRDLAAKTFLAANERHEAFRVECRVRRKDGVYRWAIDAAAPRFNALGEFLGYIGSVVDITERKQTEEALRQSEERFRLAQSAARVGTWGWNIQTGESHWSEGIYSLLGLEQGNGKVRVDDFIEFIHPEDRERTLGKVDAVIKNDEYFDDEFRIIRRDGTITWLASKGRVIRSASGQAEWMTGINLDITERKQAELELLALRDALAAEVTAMTRLHQFSTQLLASAELQPILEETLDAVIALLNADFGCVQLYNPETKVLEIVAQRGLRQDFLDYFKTVAEGVGCCGMALQRRERVAVEDVQSDPIFEPYREIMAAADVRAVQSTPLFSRSGAPLGMLSTYFCQPHHPSDYELRYVDLYARQAAELIELKQAEQARRESEQRLSEAQAIAHVGSFHWDVTANAVAWSDELYRIYGLRPGKSPITFETYIKQVHPEHQEKVRRVVERALTDQKPFEHEYQIIQPTGKVRWVFARCQPVLDAGGNLVALQGICQDITERKCVEAELRRSNEELQALNEALCNTTEELTYRKEELEAREEELRSSKQELQAINLVLEANLTELDRANSDLQNLITSTQIGTIFLDRSLRIKRYTPPVRGLFNILPSDLNRPIEHLTPNFDYATLPADAERVLAKSTIVEREVCSKAGHWYIMRLLPYRTQEDKVNGVVITFVEITERKQIEERLRRFYELPLVGMAVTAPDRRFIVVNQKLCDMLGYPEEELTGMSWIEVTYPEDIAENVRLLEQTLRGETEGYVMDKRFIHRQGHLVYTSISARCVRRDDGAVDHLLLIVQDITERKQAEQAVRASETRYRALFEKASDAIFLVTEQDDILEVNQEACNLLGYSRAKLLATKVTAFQAPEVRGRVGKIIARGLEKSRDVRFESVALHRNGRKIPVEITSTMVEEGERRLVLSIVRDITERKRIERQKQEQITSIVESEAQQNNFARIIGQSPALREMISTAEKVAAADISPVLITGETGVGKGMIARAIHYTSYRAPFAFSHIDCASIPESLFESELFGHEQGAFTDARKARRGRLELAKGGTVFLDEISEIPLNLQAKLLQLLQEGTFHRIGGREEVTLDARVIAATNRNLRADVAAGRFRADLYQRLFVVQIDVPPLRARTGDALLLAEHFRAVYNKKYGKNIRRLAPPVVEALSVYSWPGNVRELEHAIERAVLFEESAQLTLKHLRLEADVTVEPPPHESDVVTPVPSGAAQGTLDQINETIIKQVVEQCGGNITKSARRLGISRSRIYRVLYGTNEATPANHENGEEEQHSSFVN